MYSDSEGADAPEITGISLLNSSNFAPVKMNFQNNTNHPGFAKDIVYRFLNSMYINWQLFLVHLAGTTITTHRLGLTSENRINAIVIDDTFHGRLRSKYVELLANLHDHAGKGSKFKKDFRMLTLGWTDGNTFLPLIFSLLSSEDKKKRRFMISTTTNCL